MAEQMTKVRYVGPQREVMVQIGAGRVVKVRRNHQAELPTAVADGLLVQEADWEQVKERSVTVEVTPDPDDPTKVTIKTPKRTKEAAPVATADTPPAASDTDDSAPPAPSEEGVLPSGLSVDLTNPGGEHGGSTVLVPVDTAPE